MHQFLCLFMPLFVLKLVDVLVGWLELVGLFFCSFVYLFVHLSIRSLRSKNHRTVDSNEVV